MDSQADRDSHLSQMQERLVADAAHHASGAPPREHRKKENLMSPATTTPARPPKRRRARGSGAVYRLGKLWWIAYRGPDGRRVKESSKSVRKGDAERLLQSRTGAVTHHLPVVKHAEHLTFDQAARAVLDDAAVNHPRSLRGARTKLAHLAHFFGGRRMAGIDTSHVVAFVAHRQAQGIVARQGPRKGERVADVSNAEINRELALLKRTFSLAIERGLLAARPTIKLLTESAPRSGFFEREQHASVMVHLPVEIRPVIAFAYITGWRIASEVLPLEWRQIDFEAGEVRLDAGTTKNGDGRVFPMTADLRRVLEQQHAEHEALKKAGHIFPRVFWRMVADGRGGEKRPRAIVSFNKAWKVACRAAGCPGKIPRRPAADGRPQHGPQRHPRTRRDAALGAQDAERLRPLRHRQRQRPQGRRRAAGRGSVAPRPAFMNTWRT